MEGKRAAEYEKNKNPILLGCMLNVCFNRKFESQLLFQQPVQVNELPHSSDQGQSGIPAVLGKTYIYFTLRCIIFLIPLNFPLELLSDGKQAQSPALYIAFFSPQRIFQA